MSKSFQLIDVFTPSTPARVTFVERTNSDLNDQLVRALQMPGNQVIIYGHTGSGKSTLLENVLYRTYEKQVNTNCMKGMMFEDVILDAFDQLGEFYVNEITNNKRTEVNAGAKSTYLTIQT
jgi:excinuclease UvrABC ATPase subunit